jgi:hypothetical protein
MWIEVVVSRPGLYDFEETESSDFTGGSAATKLAEQGTRDQCPRDFSFPLLHFGGNSTFLTSTSFSTAFLRCSSYSSLLDQARIASINYQFPASRPNST